MTKKKEMKLIILAIVMLISMIPTSNVHAAAPKINKSYKVWLYEKLDHDAQYSIYIENRTKNGKITKIENENPNIADVQRHAYNKSGLSVKAKTEGTTKITFLYAGKKYSTQIIVKKWESPCQKFKIGNTDYAGFFNISDTYCTGKHKKDIKAKISIKPKTGWKLVKIESYPAHMLKYKIKNNSKMKLSIKQNWTEVYVYFKHKETKEKIRLKFLYSGSKGWRGGNYFYEYY